MTEKEEKLNEQNKYGEEEYEENLEENQQKIDEKIKEEEDDFQGYSSASKYQLFILFFFLGIINHLGTILVMTGGRLLAYELDMKDYVTIYTSVSTIFSVLTRVINSKLCLKVSYKKRVVIICFWMMAGYLSMFGVLTLHETILNEHNVLCFILSFIPCFFLGSSYAFGESAMIAYLRLFPKTLIAGWSSGTGLSGLISGGLNLLSQLINGLSLKLLYLFLTPVGFLYLILFTLTYRILKKQERKIDRIKRYSISMGMSRDTSVKPENEEKENKGEDDTGKMVHQIEIENPNVNFEKEEMDAKSIREEEDKEMENMNKSNQEMSFSNFAKVMNMCGQVIINLGLIYFLQFFCVNALIVRVCSKVDIEFLPIGHSDRGNPYRKGKFEFINLAYQVGMFISKTLIKIVRKIQPIEIYTFCIAIMNIIYIVEYYTGFLHWGYFLPIGLILGFFSGGTYAGGFYTILNSERVHKNYKELTVNVATLFNDSGTFLSGIVGFVAMKYWISDDSAFPGQEVIE
jgi:hypothetical protein